MTFDIVWKQVCAQHVPIQMLYSICMLSQEP